ncbi:unnamed protein product [Xylocopa violacea]|uniref:Uncharacterized protein n=1 Tax=Xylocopa violacea TaxID=135666 RepID=A0ABP1NGD3_XYLVO
MPPKPRTSNKKLPVIKKTTKPPEVTDAGNSSAETSSGLTQEAEDQFELELCWCIQQLELCLATGKLPEKQAHDLTKNINILKSNNAPLIKKRQIMRNTLGNYREKMALDEQKHGKSASSIKFVPQTNNDKKCTFFRKATSKSTKEQKHSESNAVSESSNENSASIDNAQTVFKFNFQIKD